MRRLRPVALALFLAVPEALPAGDGPDVVLYLVGDAGTKVPEAAVVLGPLAADAAGHRARSVIAILGDNLYPAGLPPPGAPDRAEMETRLAAQLTAAKAAGRAVLVPGNHDWAAWTRDGWNAIRRQDDFVNTHGGATVSFAPPGGCPGPVVFDVGETVRLLALDTQWWLHKHEKPVGPSSSCAQKSEEDVVAALREAIRTAGERKTVVLAHHALESGAFSGSHITWKDHIFPVTWWVDWLWLPLPGIGTLTVAGRYAFGNQQSQMAPKYRNLKEAMARAFAGAPPFIWAAGHDHDLQVIRLPGKGQTWNLISGAGGGKGVAAPAREITGTVYCRSEPGYMRIAFEKEGPARLTVVEVPDSGPAKTVFSTDLHRE